MANLERLRTLMFGIRLPPSGAGLRVSLSAGLATNERHGRSLDEIIARADSACMPPRTRDGIWCASRMKGIWRPPPSGARSASLRASRACTSRGMPWLDFVHLDFAARQRRKFQPIQFFLEFMEDVLLDLARAPKSVQFRPLSGHGACESHVKRVGACGSRREPATAMLSSSCFLSKLATAGASVSADARPASMICIRALLMAALNSRSLPMPPNE